MSEKREMSIEEAEKIASDVLIAVASFIQRVEDIIERRRNSD